ncbi:urease accessory protein UreF [Lichenicoccus sp.]|uniref:urease accessory protein UreF n=1 Tax=Lichenicoccus sp. TaxID=2781899 RepID=UPI003D10C44D
MAPRAELLPRLLTWLSPSFPTGAFAYSHGLEWAVETGAVRTAADVVDWLGALLLHGSLWTDAVLLRQAWRADTAPALQALAAFGSACSASRERQEETQALGAAFIRAIGPWNVLPDAIVAAGPEACWPLPVVMGAVLHAAGLDEAAACLAAGHASVANLVSAAVRLVPLGQTDGLRCLAALEPVLLEMTRRSAGADLDDVGGCCLLSDIAAMRHETQRTRLFRT